MNPQFSPLAAIQINNTLSSAQTLYDPATTVYDSAAQIVIQAFNQDVYYTTFGTTPTTANAFKLAAGETLTLDLTANTIVKVIEAAASAEVRYQFFAACHYRKFP